jgi:hypothetical protein
MTSTVTGTTVADRRTKIYLHFHHPAPATDRLFGPPWSRDELRSCKSRAIRSRLRLSEVPNPFLGRLL